MTNIALSSAVSSLLVIEKQMGVVSNNISNANTAGYTAESVQVGASVTNGVGTGVNDLGTISNVDKFLQASVIGANTTSSQATSFNNYYQSLQQVMGQISTGDTGGNDVSSQLATLQATLSQLAATPQNVSLANQAISNLNSVTSTLQTQSQQIQTLRTQADQQVADTVGDANTQLNNINALNTQIETAQANNQSTAALDDQRSTALKNLSADLGISYYTASNGGLQIFTSTGQPLLTGNVVNQLSHTPVTISNAMSYPSGGIAGIMVGNTDITSSITTGKLAALVQQRDVELPNAQNSLNFLAQNLSNGLNAVSNLGSASPPPSTLTSVSQAGYQATDSVSPTNNLMVRIAMVDSNGQVQSYQDVDLSGVATVGDVVAKINTAFGSTVASINGSGQMTLSSTTAGQGIAVSTLSGTLNSTNFSNFFHLNDVITSGSSASTIAVNPAMLKNSALFPTGSLNSTQSQNPADPTQQNGAPPFAGVGAGDGSTASALSSALLASQTFTTGTVTSTNSYNSPNSPLNLSGSFVINGGGAAVEVGVTAGQTLAQIAATINSAATAAGATGVSASVVGNGINQLQITSGGNAISFSNVTGDALYGLGISGAPSGYLGATTTSFAGFASDLISDVATRASDAAAQQTSTQTTLTSMQANLSNQSGVNTDQQTAQLTVLQNQYAASARVISTVTAMFSSLIQAVGGA
jgi:flagellar hook-associated protein 1 FlgK